MKKGPRHGLPSIMRCNASTTGSFEWNGLHIRDLTAHFNSQSSFAIIDVAPLAKHPLTRSSLCEKYYYLLSGQLHFHCGTEDFVLTRQDFLIIPPDTEFAYANRTNRLVQLLLAHSPRFSSEHEVQSGDFYPRMHIYHVTDVQTWAQGQRRNSAYEPPSLGTEGFIHFCDYPRLQQISEEYFPDADELLVVEVNPSLLAPQLRYEIHRKDGIHYPHLYGALNTNAVLRTVPIQRKNGSFECSVV